MKYPLFAFFVLLFSCQTEEPCNSFALGEAFELPLGKTLVHCTEEISITFVELVSDSRCPSGVQCIWEGMVEVTISLKLNGKDSIFSLSSTPDFGKKIPNSKALEGFVIRLEDVLPYPKAGSTVSKRESKVVLSIRKEV
jgi:hypothetical protein